MSDTGYGDLAVDLYDHHGPGEDRGDVAFYRERAADADGPALELACGTGRVYLELLDAGLDVDGFDASEAALAELRSRAGDRGLDPSVWQADVTDFAVEREYGLAYCPFNTLQHARTVDDQLAVLECVHDALAAGGTFVFDVFVPSFDLICETYGEWESDAAEYGGAERTVRRRTRIVDEVEQRFEVETQVLDGVGDDAEQDAEILASEVLEPTMLPTQQVELLARQSPFESWSVAGGFDGRELVDGEYVQVWTLEKAAV